MKFDELAVQGEHEDYAFAEHTPKNGANSDGKQSAQKGAKTS
jgi:hypothetical protein